MKLARYWAREPGEATGPGGRRVRAVARGWSSASLDEARARARQIATRLAGRLAAGGAPGPGRTYLYGERPLPEPIVHEFPDGAAGPRAAVTRNAYGALVLNARALMFVDIDREPPAGGAGAAGGLVSGLRALFGSAPAKTAPPADPVLGDIERVAAANRVAGRVYRTAAGYRAIVTSRALGPGAASDALLQQFGADPLYVRLCRMQESFRARLTPKPWRCGVGALPVAFPFDTPEAEARFLAWEARYAAAAARYATCRYLATVGGGHVDPALADLVAYHDRETKATSGLPLA